jgi:hypothetical protein
MSKPVVASARTPSSPRSRDAVRQAWVKRLARDATAGLPVARFCAGEGVSVAAFYLWKRRLAAADLPAAPADSGPEPGLRWLPVRLPDSAPPLELVLPTGAVLRIGAGADEATLRGLLRLLGVAPC